MNKRIHVIYSGRVQGVGFRFTAESIAKGLGLSGWVKNLSRGGVEVVAEGKQEALEEFLERIKDYFAHYISDIELEWQAPSGEFKDFGIGF